MTTKWKTYGGALGGAVLIIFVLANSLYMKDYRLILDQYPDNDLILLDYSESKVEFLARTVHPDIEFLRWKFQDEHTHIYFGNNKVGDSFYQLKCYYDLNGKKGYRNIIQKHVKPITYTDTEFCLESGDAYSVHGDSISNYDCETKSNTVILTQEIDYYRDSRHNTLIGTLTKTTELYPTTGKETIDFVPVNKDMPCQLVWRVDALDEYDRINFKSAGDDIESSTFDKEYDNGLILDWSDAEEKVSWAKQYPTARLYVVYQSLKGDQHIDPVIYIDQGLNISLTQNCSTETTYYNETADNSYYVYHNCYEVNNGSVFNDSCGEGVNCSSIEMCNKTFHQNVSYIEKNVTTNISCSPMLTVNNISKEVIITLPGGYIDHLGCSYTDNIICCDSEYDGDSNGDCKSGESYFKITLQAPFKVEFEERALYRETYETFLEELGVI